MVPINALYFYEKNLESEYINRELPDYSEMEEIDIEGEMNNRRDERIYQEYLDSGKI